MEKPAALLFYLPSLHDSDILAGGHAGIFFEDLAEVLGVVFQANLPGDVLDFVGFAAT